MDIEEFSIPLGLVEWELNAFSLVYLRPCLTFTASQPGSTDLVVTATATSASGQALPVEVAPARVVVRE